MNAQRCRFKTATTRRQNVKTQGGHCGETDHPNRVYDLIEERDERDGQAVSKPLTLPYPNLWTTRLKRSRTTHPMIVEKSASPFSPTTCSPTSSKSTSEWASRTLNTWTGQSLLRYLRLSRSAFAGSLLVVRVFGSSSPSDSQKKEFCYITIGVRSQ